MFDDVKNKFESYPEDVCIKLMEIRTAILALSDEEYVGKITETLKWGEPSYSSKFGSTVRLGWRSQYPNDVSVFFNCNTCLVETFKETYGIEFRFLGNREIRFSIIEPIPMARLIPCILMSLRYHKIKHLPLLGA